MIPDGGLLDGPSSELFMEVCSQFTFGPGVSRRLADAAEKTKNMARTNPIFCDGGAVLGITEMAGAMSEKLDLGARNAALKPNAVTSQSLNEKEKESTPCTAQVASHQLPIATARSEIPVQAEGVPGAAGDLKRKASSLAIAGAETKKPKLSEVKAGPEEYENQLDADNRLIDSRYGGLDKEQVKEEWSKAWWDYRLYEQEMLSLMGSRPGPSVGQLQQLTKLKKREFFTDAIDLLYRWGGAEYLTEDLRATLVAGSDQSD